MVNVFFFIYSKKQTKKSDSHHIIVENNLKLSNNGSIFNVTGNLIELIASEWLTYEIILLLL